MLPIVLQLGAFISPVGYLTNLLPEKWQFIYALNPVVGIIDAFRWCVLGGQYQIYWPGLALSIAVTIVIAVTGIWYFRKTERTFADVI